MESDQGREAVARELYGASCLQRSTLQKRFAELRRSDQIAWTHVAYAAIGMRDAAVAEALSDAAAEIAHLRAQLAAVYDAVNLTTIRTRSDEAWVERICRALDAKPTSDGKGVTDKPNFAETQPIRYVRK